MQYISNFYRWKFAYGPNSSNSISSFSSISTSMLFFSNTCSGSPTTTCIRIHTTQVCMSVHAHALSQSRLFDIEQNQWSYHCRLRICWAVIMGLNAKNKSSQTTSTPSNGTKPNGICIKLAESHSYLSDKKVKAMVEKLAGDWTLTDPPIGIVSDCNQDSSHEPLCESFSFNIAYHVKEEGLKERVLDIARHSQEHCNSVKETTNFDSNLIPPQNMKSRETHQDEALRCANIEVWSNFSKWGDNQEGAASTTNSSCSPSGSETSSSLSTTEMSTLSCQSEASSFSFNWREKEKEKEKEKEGEPLSNYTALDSSHNITLSSTMMSNASLTHNGLEKMDVSVDGYKEIITTPPHIKTAKGHGEKVSSPPRLHDETSIWSPQICVRPKNNTTKVKVWPPSTILSPKSKIINKVPMPSENQSNGVSEHGFSRSSLSNAPERSVKFVSPNHEKISENAFKSTTEAKGSHLSRLALSHHPCNKQGMLHCVCKDGLPYYTFSLNECGQALAAKACKLNFCTEDLDWIYTFHSGQDNKKKSYKSKWNRKDRHTPDLDLVGWMRVSSSLHPQFNSIGSLEHTLETEFVLFSAGSKHHHKTDFPTVQDNIVHFRPSNQLDHMTSSSEISFDIFSQSTPPSTPLSTWSTSPKPEMMKKTRLDNPSRPPSVDLSTLNAFKSRSADGNTTTLENRGNTDNMSEAEFCALQPYSPHLESSAIVIRTPFSQSKSTVKVASGKDSTHSKDCGGWGLKFLEKSSWKQKHESCTSQYNNILARSSTDFDDRLRCGKQYESSVTAILSANVHGLPTIKSRGPSSLVERWKFDGKCDCGGWDLGCPITLLHNQRQSIVNSNSNSMPQDCHSLHVLFKEGQQHTPALTMSAVNEGLYAISFESQLSDLQVFSICLALIHDREKDVPVPPFRNKSRESYLRSSTRSPLRASRQVFSIPAERDIGNQPSLRPSLSSFA